MKTTNLEISKKLKEIGFKADYDSVWCEHKKTKEIKVLSCDFDCWDYVYYYNTLAPAYDLETLLEAMPAFIKNRKENYYFWLGGKGIGYYSQVNDKYYLGGNIVYDMDDPFLISFNNEYKKMDESSDDSLADMAGILIIALHEKGFIKFGGKND